jgi:hypothetical protein
MTLTLDRPEPNIENVQIPDKMIAECANTCDPQEANNGNVSVTWENNSWFVTNISSARFLSCAKKYPRSVTIKFIKN